MTLPVSREVKHARDNDDLVVLNYDARFLRRKVLTSENGLKFLVDLPHTTSVDSQEAFVLEDGRRIRIIPAAENLLEIQGDLTQLAWHIGNRHTPCQIENNRLLIQHDHVLRDMLTKLGATVNEVTEAFTPEGGAYGHGRTHSHAH